jgi:hypothetical protein
MLPDCHSDLEERDLKRGWPDYERHDRPIMALRKVAQGVRPRAFMAAADGTGGTEQEGRPAAAAAYRARSRVATGAPGNRILVFFFLHKVRLEWDWWEGLSAKISHLHSSHWIRISWS